MCFEKKRIKTGEKHVEVNKRKFDSKEEIHAGRKYYTFFVTREMFSFLYKNGKMQNRRLELARPVDGPWNQTLASLASASIIKVMR